MHVGTVGKHLDAHTRRELRRQALVGKGAAGNRLSGLADEQRERVLHLPDLALEVDLLRLHLIVGSLGTLHGGRAVADTVVVHELHLLPSLLRQLLHVGDNLHLTVEHQKGIIEVGDA